MKRLLFLAVAAMILTACQESLEQRAQRTLKEYNDKNCPIQLRENIIMDSCSFDVASHTLHYYYTLMGELDNDSTLNTESMRQLLEEGLRNETHTRIFKDAGYNFSYTYHSFSTPQKVLFETTLTKEDY